MPQRTARQADCTKEKKYDEPLNLNVNEGKQANK
jgi:hypothetical protein